MTAKAAPAQEFATAGKGKKFCPHCSAVIAARSQTCPECNKAIAPKNPQGTKTKTSKGGASVASVLDTLEGLGMDEIQASIDAVEAAQEAQSKIDSLGGLDVAKRLLALAGKLSTPGAKPAKKKVV